MKIGLVLYSSAGFQTALERMYTFLKPLMDGVDEISCCYLEEEEDTVSNNIKQIKRWLYSVGGNKIRGTIHWGQTGRAVSMNQAAHRISGFLKTEAADLNLFYGNDSGTYLGSMAAVLGGMSCFPQADAISWQGSYVCRVQRTVYDAHVNGSFEWDFRHGPAAVIVSENGLSESFRADAESGEAAAAINKLQWQWESDLELISSKKKEHEDCLTNARLVFVGGRGLHDKENFEKLKELAEKAGADWGCTRAAALSGWADFSRVVGVSGKTLHADTCVLFGVSGAGPFLYGTELVKQLIAINRDRNAPIFSAAHIGLEYDCIKVLDELKTLYERR